MSTTQWSELDRKEKRDEIIRTIIVITAAWISLFAIYYLLPFENVTNKSSVIRMFVGIIGFIGMLVWQLRRITRAKYPGMRAVQALGVAIPIFLVVFAIAYATLSQASSSHFSEPLNHTGAMYLTITVFSTVGFGDITPKGDLARVLVSIQMILDLIVIGAVARLLTTAAKSGMRAADKAAEPDTNTTAKRSK